MIQYLLGIYSLLLLERVFAPEIQREFLLKYGYLINTLYLLIGPFVYTYVRRLLFYKNGNFRLGYLHYLPAILYLVYGLIHVINFDSIKDNYNYFVVLLFCNEVLFFISITAYLFKSNSLLNYYKKNEENEFSFQQPIKNYVTVMLLCLLAYMFFWVLGILERFVVSLWFDILFIYDVSCLIFGIQIYIVGFYSLKHPQIFKIQLPSNNKSPRRNRIDESEIQKIQKSIHVFFEEKKGYRQSDLSLWMLANEISTTTNNLSWVLNNVHKKSFYKLVNEYRVQEFLDRINKNDHKELTLVSIAMDVGFSSKSTFYKVFKEVVKVTPSEYIKSMKT